MLLANLDEVVLAHQRLAAGIDVDMGAEGLALRDDGVDIIEREVLLITILGSPAAGAMQIASARGIEQDGPRNVALVLLAVLFLLGPCE